MRDQFLTELDMRQIRDLPDLNARLQAWLEQVYHVRVHDGLAGDATPLRRFQQDLAHVRPSGPFASRMDELFYHRNSRKVRKDGTVSFDSRFFEVPCELVGQTVMLVTDPHEGRVLFAESPEGERLGAATPLDAEANSRRKRQRSVPAAESSEPVPAFNVVEQAYQRHAQAHRLIDKEE
ncbi:MAG: hypothetical protein GY835_02980 [bacterium]|nr:hypothetical protein [bacterium]